MSFSSAVRRCAYAALATPFLVSAQQAPAAPAPAAAIATIAARTAGLDKRDGFIPAYLN